MNVDNVYINIDPVEGAYVCYKKLENHENKTLIKEFEELDSINIFQFCGTIHLQQKGTVNSPVTADYANLFMDLLKTSLLNYFHK